MVIHSRWTCPVTNCSLQQWIFGSSTNPLPDRKAIIDAERPDTHFLTFAGYRLLAKRIGLGLQQAGLRLGDRVLVLSANNIYYPSVFLGILMAGGIYTGASPTFVAREVVYQLRDSDASFMFAATDSLDVALQAADEAGLARHRILLFDADVDVAAEQQQPEPAHLGRQRGIRHWTELLQGSSAEAARWDWAEPAAPEETTCCLNYSSGTMGLPKGVEISHYAYVANCSQVSYIVALHPDYRKMTERARSLAFLPMYHAYGQTYYITSIPHRGIPLYVMPRFDFLKMLRHIQNLGITTLACVPPIILALTKQPASRKFDLSSVETIGSGAAPLAADVAAECESLFKANEVRVSQGWGMTETTCTHMAWDDQILKGCGGVGELLPNCSAKIMELDGKTEILEAKRPGELWVSGPNLFRRYWRKPDATREAVAVDADGTRWLRTGDIAQCDEYRTGAIWHIVDRVKELIKVKGNQVAPAELEGLLLENSAVADVGVIGVTIDGEEYPRAYIEKTAGSRATENEIAEWLAGKVTSYKQLKGGVMFIDVVPRNPSGKILRKMLRDRAKKEVGDQKPLGSKI